MSIVLDPNKSSVQISIFYIEEKKKNGNSVFKFATSGEQMEEWKTKGYRTRGEILQESQGTATTPNAARPIQVRTVIEVLNTTWKRMSWKEQNTIFSQSLRIVGTESEIDALKYRDMKLKMCLKKWDAKDDEGSPIPLSTDTIDNLCPEVASELLRAFERVTEPSDDDQK